MRKKLTVVLLLAVTAAYGQKASIKRVELAGEKIVVHYDLEDSNPANEYQISLYSSQSNFATALTKVGGDVGMEVKPGANKKIEWSIREELGPYKGKLSLEIRGKMFVPIAKINNVSEGDKFKRGKTHTLTWKPGNSNQITIELMKGDQPIQTQNNQSNSGTYSFLIAPHTPVGKDYSIRITDTKDNENVVRSQHFTVTRKVPLLLKVLPILALGGAVSVLAGGGGGTSDSGTGNNGGTAIELPGFPQ